MRRIAWAILAGLLTCSPGSAEELETAIFAGGCFWCVESDFDKVPGVKETVSGYIGGSGEPVTYQTHGALGYREAVEIRFDPQVTSYETLVDLFFRSVDPTDAGGQFCDRGHSYTTAIYTLDDPQKQIAEAGRAAAAEALGTEIVTAIEPAPEFFPAEEYHQDFHRKNDFRYSFYRINCGRDLVLSRLWGDKAWAGAK